MQVCFAWMEMEQLAYNCTEAIKSLKTYRILALLMQSQNDWNCIESNDDMRNICGEPVTAVLATDGVGDAPVVPKLATVTDGIQLNSIAIFAVLFGRTTNEKGNRGCVDLKQLVVYSYIIGFYLHH